ECSLSFIFLFVRGSNVAFPSNANLIKLSLASLYFESAPINGWDAFAFDKTNSACAPKAGYAPTGFFTDGFGHQPEKPPAVVCDANSWWAPDLSAARSPVSSPDSSSPFSPAPANAKTAIKVE